MGTVRERGVRTHSWRSRWHNPAHQGRIFQTLVIFGVLGGGHLIFGRVTYIDCCCRVERFKRHPAVSKAVSKQALPSEAFTRVNVASPTLSQTFTNLVL
jgi:hypothetical protein